LSNNRKSGAATGGELSFEGFEEFAADLFGAIDDRVLCRYVTIQGADKYADSKQGVLTGTPARCATSARLQTVSTSLFRCAWKFALTGTIRRLSSAGNELVQTDNLRLVRRLIRATP
jgi:hypothetical protein